MNLRPLVAAAAVSLGTAACGDPQIGEASRGLQCGPSLDFTPVNAYRGGLPAVHEREDAVALINGNCTGTLVAAQAGPVVLTAGHCVGLGDRSLVVFNFEADPDGDPLVTNGTVIERSDAPDYALIQLDALPAVSPTALTTESSTWLAIIQHPRGTPKVVAEGRFAGFRDGLITYADLDTLVGSSGAGVLNCRGQLLGIHTDGDCAEDGSGTNTGATAVDIVRASAYLQDVDLEGC
jgi:trypsin-like peptidase